MPTLRDEVLVAARGVAANEPRKSINRYILRLLEYWICCGRIRTHVLRCIDAEAEEVLCVVDHPVKTEFAQHCRILFYSPPPDLH